MWLLLLCESSFVANGCFAASVVYGRHGFSSGGLSPFVRSLSSSVHSTASLWEVSGVFISALVLALGSPPMCWPELREYRIRFSDLDQKLRVASYESVGVARSLEIRLKIDHPSVGISTWSIFFSLQVMKTMYSEFATSASHFGLEGVDVLVALAIEGKHSFPDSPVFCASFTGSVAMMMKSSGSSYSGKKTTRTAAVS